MTNGIAIAVLCFGMPFCVTAYSGEVETVEDIWKIIDEICVLNF